MSKHLSASAVLQANDADLRAALKRLAARFDSDRAFEAYIRRAVRAIWREHKDDWRGPGRPAERPAVWTAIETVVNDIMREQGTSKAAIEKQGKFIQLTDKTGIRKQVYERLQQQGTPVSMDTVRKYIRLWEMKQESGYGYVIKNAAWLKKHAKGEIERYVALVEGLEKDPFFRKPYTQVAPSAPVKRRGRRGRLTRDKVRAKLGLPLFPSKEKL